MAEQPLINIQETNKETPIYQPFCNPTQGISLPVQEILPLNNYSPQTQTNNNTPNNYQIYQNISEIPHWCIQQIDSNTFFIPLSFECCCDKFCPFIACFIGFSLVIGYIFLSIFIMKSFWNPCFIMLYFGIFIIIAGFCGFHQYQRVYFYLEQNSLKIVKKAICAKKIKIYNTGELERVDFLYKYSYELDDDGDGSYIHHYDLIFVTKTGIVNKIFSRGETSKIFTQEEIDYFLYYMNNHIQTKMNMRELN